jgi:hypothetical protein
VNAHAEVRHMLRAEGLEERIGVLSRSIALADVVDEFLGETRMEIVATPTITPA